MATYCLLAFWLVESLNWNSTHCSRTFDGVFSKVLTCNSTFSRVKTLFRAFGKVELYFEKSSKLYLETNEKYWKSHSYSLQTAFYSYTSTKAYKQVKNTANLTRTSLENNITAALIWSTNKETLTSTTSLENNITAALIWSTNKETLTSTTSLENNITAALIWSTNKETLTSTTSLENNITATLKWSNYTENLASKSLENNITATLTGRKCSRKPTVDEYDGLETSQTSIFEKSLQNSNAETVVVRSAIVFTALSFSDFAVSLQFHWSWGLLLAWRITFQDCIAEEPTRCGPGRRHFPSRFDQNVILNGKNNGTTYANQNLGMTIQWKILARQKADMELHSHPIVWRRSTTKGSERQGKRMRAEEWKEMAHETKVKLKETNLGKQKNVGVNAMEFASLSKREPFGEGLELLRGWKKVNRIQRKPGRKTIQIAAEEGLELVRGSKGSQSEEKTLPVIQKESGCS